MANVNTTVTIPPVPEGFNEDINGLLTYITENAIFTSEGSFLVGQINGADPGIDVGVWIDGKDILVWNAQTAKNELINTVPIGAVLDFAGQTAPEHYLDCDGSLLVRADYPSLFSIIGTDYNKTTDVDDTKFRLPDFRGRVAVGAGIGDYNAHGDGVITGLMIERAIGAYFGREDIQAYIAKLATQPAQTPSSAPPPSITSAPVMRTVNGTAIPASGTNVAYTSCVQPSLALKKIIRFE